MQTRVPPSLLNICGPCGCGKTSFVLDWATKVQSGLQLLTPSRIGEVIRKTDVRFNCKLARVYVFDEMDQWDTLSLTQTLHWLVNDFGKNVSIQVAVVSQTELPVLLIAGNIGATVNTVRLNSCNVEFDRDGFIASINQRLSQAVT